MAQAVLFRIFTMQKCCFISMRMLEQEMSVQDLAEQLRMKNSDLVLISNELGYGVVPMDVFDRNYRETTGRVCTEIASEADAVYRVVCGIGTKIK